MYLYITIYVVSFIVIYNLKTMLFYNQNMICKEKSLHIVYVHRVINMSNETVYHGRQDDVQYVHSMYEVTEHDIKLKPGWKVMVGGWCTLAMLLECTDALGEQGSPYRL